MKVIIIGAGEQGYVLTWNLVKHLAVDEVLIADYDEAKAIEVAGGVAVYLKRSGTATPRSSKASRCKAVGCVSCSKVASP
jgi:saccharopine dehydrogenase-like NADP-dependent oxidoreductase